MTQTSAAKPPATDLHFRTGDVLVGDALSRLTELPDNSVDAVACDPPYGLTELPPALVTSAVTAWVTSSADWYRRKHCHAVTPRHLERHEHHRRRQVRSPGERIVLPILL